MKVGYSVVLFMLFGVYTLFVFVIDNVVVVGQVFICLEICEKSSCNNIFQKMILF